MRNVVFACAVLALALGGCAPDSKVAPAGPAGGASPIENYKQARLREAMKGLNYSTGLVRVDPDQVAKRGTEAQASAERSRAESQLTEVNDSIEAIRAWTKAVILNPDNAAGYVGLGRALITKGRIDEAQAAYKTSLGIDPKNADTHMRLGNLYEMQNRMDDAMASWKESLKLNPRNAEAHSRLAVQSYFHNQFIEAWGHVQSAERLGGEVPAQLRAMLAEKMPEPKA